VRARNDSIFRADSARRAAAGLRPTDTALARRREVRQAERRDSVARLRRPRPNRRIPARQLVVQLGVPVHPGTYYRLQAIEIRGLLGKTRTSDRVFSVPKPASDSAHARSARDSARAGRPGAARSGAPRSGRAQSGQPPGQEPPGQTPGTPPPTSVPLPAPPPAGVDSGRPR
jgi:hypothetical protein